MVHRLGDQSDKNISSGQNAGLQEVLGVQGDDRYRLQKRVGGISPLLFGTYGEFFRDKDGSYASLYRVAKLILPSALYYTWNAFLDFQCDDLPPSVTLKQVAEHTNKNLRTIELNVQRLRQLGYLYTRHAPRDGMCVVEKCFDGLYKAVVEYLEWEKSASYIPPLREFFAIDQLDLSICNQLLRFNNYRRLIRNKKPGPKPKKAYAEEECVNGVFREIAEEVISPANNSSVLCLSLLTPNKEIQPQERENEQREDEQAPETQEEPVSKVEEEQTPEPIAWEALPGLYMSAKLMKSSPEGEIQVEEEQTSEKQEDRELEKQEDQVLEKEEEQEAEVEEDREPEMQEEPAPEMEEEQHLQALQCDKAPDLSICVTVAKSSSEKVQEQGISESSLQEQKRTVLSSQSSSLEFRPDIQVSFYRKSKKLWVLQGVAPYYTDLEWERLKEISATKIRLGLEWNKYYDIRNEHLDAIEIIDRNSRAYINTAGIMPETKPWLPKRLRELNAERDLYLLKIRKSEDDSNKVLAEIRVLTTEARALVRIAGRRQFQHAATYYKKQGYGDFIYRKISWKARATGLFLPIRFVRDKPILWNTAVWGVAECNMKEERYSEEQPQDTQEYIQPSQEESQQGYGYVEGQVCSVVECVEGSIVESSIVECVERQVCSSSMEGEQECVECSPSIEEEHKEQPHVQIKNVMVRTAHQVVSLLPVGVHIQLEQLVVEKLPPPENETAGQQALPETSMFANGHISETPKKEPEGQQNDILEQSLQKDASDPSGQKRGRRDRRRGAQKEVKQLSEDRQGEVGVTPEKQAEQGAVNGVQGVYTVAESGGLKGFLFDVTSPEAWIKVWKEYPEMVAKIQDAVHTAQAVKLGADDAERQKKGEPLLNCSEIGQSLVREAYIHTHPSEPLPPKVAPVDQGKKMREDTRTIEYIDNYMREKEKAKEQAYQQQRHLKRQDDLAREEEQARKEQEMQAQPDIPRSAYTSPLPPGVRDLGGGMIAIPFKSRDDMIVMREDITLEDFFFQFAGGRQPRKSVASIRDPRFKHEDDIPRNTGPVSIAFKEHYMAQQARRIEEAKNAEKIYYDASRDPYSAFYKGEKPEQQENKQWHMGDGFVSRGFLELRKKMEKERENGRE